MADLGSEMVHIQIATVWSAKFLTLSRQHTRRALVRVASEASLRGARTSVIGTIVHPSVEKCITLVLCVHLMVAECLPILFQFPRKGVLSASWMVCIYKCTVCPIRVPATVLIGRLDPSLLLQSLSNRLVLGTRVKLCKELLHG